MFPHQDLAEIHITVVNQTTPDKLIPRQENPSIQVINSFQKGLSASRNLALLSTDKKLCLLADDDIVYKQGFIDVVLAAFNQNPDAVLISFRTQNQQGELLKKYPSARKSNLSVLDRLSIMSVEMAVNNEILKKEGVRFDTRFGLGANFPLGEEAVLINQLHNKGMKIVMEPQVINIHPAHSSTETIANTEKYFTLGAVYTAIFGNKYKRFIMLKLLFDVKQGRVKAAEILTMFKIAVQGYKKYKATNEENNNT